MDAWGNVVQIISALVGAVAGWLLSYYFPSNGRRIGTPENGNILISRSTVRGDVNVGNTKVLLHDNRVYLSASGASEIAKKSDDPLDTSAERVRERRERELREERRHQEELRSLRDGATSNIRSDAPKTHNSDTLTTIFLWVVALVGIAWVYLAIRDALTFWVGLVASFALAFALTALAGAAIRSVKLSWGLKSQAVVNAILAAGALLSLNWLSDPPFVSDSAAYKELLGGGEMPLAELAKMAFSPEGWPLFSALLFQILGVTAVVIGLILILAHTVSMLAISGLAVRLRQDNSHAPGWLRRFLMTLLGGPTRSFAAAAIVTVIGLACMAGVIGTLVQQSQASFVDTVLPVVPAPPPSEAPAVP